MAISSAAAPPFVIFDASDMTATTVSGTYRVEPGSALFLTAYRVPGAAVVRTEAVWTRTWSRELPGPRTGPAGPLHVPATTELRSMTPTIGGAERWTMDAAHAQMVIVLPGLYRFVLDDFEPFLDTDFLLTGEFGRPPAFEGWVFR